MAQVFSKRSTLLIRAFVLGGVCLVALAVLSYRVNARNDPPEGAPVHQIIPFSHKHHAGDDGIDCRFCHVSVESSRFAGMPSLATCMTCHSQLFTDQPVLSPLLTAVRSATPLAWNRVNDLPDFVYFDHAIHVHKGVGCSTCHGEVDRMPLIYRVASLDMQWCLDCHRAPEKYLRPSDRIYDMRWHAPADQTAQGDALKTAFSIRSVRHLEMCSTCHR